MSTGLPHPGVLVLFLGLPLAPAQAQTLADVVVSASRAEQRSFDAPAAIQSIGREQIQSAGPQVNLSESLTRVPGITILDRGNFAQDLQVSIRGFGARAAFGIRGVRLLIDGVPATTPDGQGQASSISLTSMQSIEVLRGPIALLYGNSSGGVIQAFTKNATLGPQVDYQTYAGSYGMRRANYQFSDTVGMFGIVADYGTFSTDGYRNNSQAQRKQFNGKLRFAPSEQFIVNVIYNQFDMPLAQDPLGLTAGQWSADPTQAGTGAVTFSTRKAVLQNQLGMSARYRLDANRSITGRVYYGTRDNLQYQTGAATGPTSSGAWTGLSRNFYGTGLQYNVQALWGQVPVDIAAGYEFDRSREFREGGVAALGQKSRITRSEDNQSENTDFFVQGTARVAEHWSLVGGLRSSTVRFVSDDYFVTGTDPDGSGNTRYSATSPVFGLTFHASDALNIYANFGRGFETPTLAEMAYSGTAAPLAVFNPLLNASTSQHYELGAKWVPTQNSRIDFALYQINTTDELVVAVNSAGRSAFKNAPGTRRNGWELSANTFLTPHVSALVSASMIDAQYAQSFMSLTPSGTTSVLSGNKIPGIPESSFFSELAWNSENAQSRMGAPAMGTRLGIEWVQTGRIYANDLNTETTNAYTVFNLAASHRWPVGKGTLTWYGRLNNATNEKYVGSVIVNQASRQFYEPGMPRNWTTGLSLSVPL